MPNTLNTIQALLLEAASMVAKLQSEPKRQAKRKPSTVEAFVNARCYHIPGAITEFAAFKAAFASWLPPEDVGNWWNDKIIKALPVFCAYGPHTGNVRCVGNLSLVNTAPANQTPFQVNEAGRLVREGAKR